MKRFRVKTEFMYYKPSEHRYFSSLLGAKNHILRRIYTQDVYRVTLFDNDRHDDWGQLIHGGYVGSVGGLGGNRSGLIAIARVFQDEELGKMFGLFPGEWLADRYGR